MDNEILQGETSTPRTHDRGEISGIPNGADPEDATSEAPLRQERETPEDRDEIPGNDERLP